MGSVTAIRQDDAEALAERATAEIARLEGEVTRLAAEAEAAAVKFRKEPTGPNHTASAVAAQKATNAVEALAAFVAESSDVRLAGTRVQQQRELAELRPLMEWNKNTDADLARVKATFVAFQESLTAALESLRHRLIERNAKASQATTLEQSVGDASKSYQKVSLRDALNDVCVLLGATPGQIESLTRIAFLDRAHGGTDSIECQVRFPFSDRVAQ